jgi:hypothetical protein
MENVENTPRGIRNNNPGNIRWGVAWDGLVPESERTDPDFCQFARSHFGLRALAMNLRNYQRRDGLKTVREMITRWAPPRKNNTESYILVVSERMRVSANQDIDLNNRETLRAMVEAIIMHENGFGPTLYGRWYPQSEIDSAIADALGGGS